MADPYRVLGISTNTDEEGIRRRYLALIKQYTPEKAPQRFAEIRAAYEELRDPIQRMQQQLLKPTSGESIDDVIADVRSQLHTKRIPTETLLSLAEV